MVKFLEKRFRRGIKLRLFPCVILFCLFMLSGFIPTSHSRHPYLRNPETVHKIIDDLDRLSVTPVLIPFHSCTIIAFYPLCKPIYVLHFYFSLWLNYTLPETAAYSNRISQK